MMQIARTATCDSPSHIIKCSKSRDTAFVVSIPNKTYTKYTWSNTTEDDTEKIDEVNSKLPDCKEIKSVITGKIGKKLAHIYLCENIISFEDEIFLEVPDAIFLQRVSPQTKTFDMVCFYDKEYKMISIVDKSDLDTIREWYPNKIFSCGADPLPMESVKRYLENFNGDNMYEKLFSELTEESESSCSEYEASSSDTDDDYISDEDDEIKPQESDYESAPGFDYEVGESDFSDDEYERPNKKIKL